MSSAAEVEGKLGLGFSCVVQDWQGRFPDAPVGLATRYT